ncbi:MAG: lysoplasmalogenase family protein [Paracoccaceae bacterium]
MSDLTMLAFWAGLLAAFAYLPLSAREPGLLRSASKTVPLLCFASSAYLAGAHAFLTAALLLSAVGDLALSRPSQRAFNYGLAAFSLTHVLYTLLFTAISGAPLWAAFAEAPLFAVPMIAMAISAEIWLLPHTGARRWPVRVYVALITAMMLSALILPALFFIATLGAAAFVASDFILALQMFRMNVTAKLRAATGWLVWGLYIGGQSMILWGAALT